MAITASAPRAWARSSSLAVTASTVAILGDVFAVDARGAHKAKLFVRLVCQSLRAGQKHLSLSTHASFTAVPLAMTAGAPSVMLIVA